MTYNEKRRLRSAVIATVNYQRTLDNEYAHYLADRLKSAYEQLDPWPIPDPLASHPPASPNPASR